VAAAPMAGSPSPLRNLRALLALAGPRRRLQLFVTLILTALGAFAELVTIGAVLPLLALAANPGAVDKVPVLRGVLDAVGIGAGGNLMVPAATILIAAAIVSTALRLLLTWVGQEFVYGLHQDVMLRVFGRAVRQPYEWYVKQNSSAFVAGVDKIYVVIVGIVGPGLVALTSGAIALCITLFLFVIDPRTAFAAALSVGLLYAFIILVSRRSMRKVSTGLASARTERIKIVQESLGGLRDILLEQSQPVFEAKLERHEYRYRRLLVTANVLSLGPRIVIEGASVVLMGALAVWFSLQPGGVLAAIPVLGALALGAQRLLPLVQAVYLGWAGYAVNAHMLQDVVDLLNTPATEPVEMAAGQEVSVLTRDVELRQVSFSYSTDAPALHAIDLLIRKGDRVGLIGKTGSGKSTLVDLLMGLLKPTGGAILVDGRPLDADSLPAWQSQIAHVPQAIFLADDTIAANIAFGCSEDEIDMDRVRLAAARADIADYIEELPEGFSTAVGERGIRLSGGQRQRIGIARALYKNATVLILDEATSALDEETERAVMASVDKLQRELTIVLIAHRLSTVATCDRVYRLEGGTIVQQGRFDEVVGQAADAVAAGAGR
jgi:ABC-type multidrug transport system fused ATPase/permease subunit